VAFLELTSQLIGELDLGVAGALRRRVEAGMVVG